MPPQRVPETPINSNLSPNNPFLKTTAPTGMASVPDATLPDNPFAEAALKNQAVRSVSFNTPEENAAKAAKGSAGINKKFIIFAVAALVVIIAIVAILLMTSSTGKKSTPTPANNTPTSKAGTYACERDYLESEFDKFGTAVVSAKETFTLTLSDTSFDKLEQLTVVQYDDADAVRAGFRLVSDAYETAYADLGLTVDPFDTTYKRDNDVLKITRSAQVEDLKSSDLGLLDINVTTTPSSLTSDDLQDTLEANNFSCHAVVNLTDNE